MIKQAGLVLIALAALLLSACNRIVSVEPLLAGAPPSAQHWEGAYTSVIDASDKRPFPMLLQLERRGPGGYEFTIHARGVAQDIFSGSGDLALIGRGEVRIVDLGENYAVAQTRCEMTMLTNTADADKFGMFQDLLRTARRFGEASGRGPQSKYIGPFVYALLRGSPASAQAIMGIDGETPVTEAAQGTTVDVDKWQNGAGDGGFLIGSNLAFEADDLHLATHGGPGSAVPFFGRLARKVFSEYDVKNAVAWTRVEPDKLRGLRFNDRFPAEGRALAWCNLLAAMPADKKQ